MRTTVSLYCQYSKNASVGASIIYDASMLQM